MQLGTGVKEFARGVAKLLDEPDEDEDEDEDEPHGHSPTLALRRAAVTALGEMEAAEFACNVFQQSIGRPHFATDRLTRQAVVRALSKMGVSTLLPYAREFAPMIHSDDDEHGMAALDRLSAIDAFGNWAAPLNAWLTTVDDLLAMRAMRLHGHASVNSAFDASGASARLSFWMVKMSDPTVPLWLQCRILRHVRDWRYSPLAIVESALSQALEHPKASLRVDALRCIQRLGVHAGSVSPAVVRALADSSSTVRRTAIDTLPKLGAAVIANADAEIDTLLRHSDCGVRRSTMVAIQRLGSNARRYARVLRLELRNSADDDVRTIARQTLVAIGASEFEVDEAVRPFARRLSDSTEQDIHALHDSRRFRIIDGQDFEIVRDARSKGMCCIACPGMLPNDVDQIWFLSNCCCCCGWLTLLCCNHEYELEEDE